MRQDERGRLHAEAARDIMRAVPDAEALVRDLRAQRAHYMDVATGAGMSIGDGIHGGPLHGGRVEAAATRLADIDRQMDEAMGAYARAHARAAELIGQLHGSRARRLMTLRYLCGASWRDIQREMGYQDDKSAYRLHGGALAEMDEILRHAG